MKSILLYFSLAVVVLQGCSHSNGKQARTPRVTERIPVRVQPLVKENQETIIQTSGQFTTDDETYLAFKTGGVIDQILVKEGDAIRSGQVLARLNLTEIESQVAQASLAFDKAKRDFARVENLYRDSVATLEQYQNARTGMDVAARQFEAANFNRSYSEIRAVSNGFVLRKMASEGQVISPGTPVLLTNGAGRDNWLLKAGVSDREWAAVQVGDKAVVSTDALPDQSFEARVTRKSEGTDAGSGAFVLELSIENPKGLAAGLFGRARITASRQQVAWQIPYEALLDGDAQSGYVFVTEDNQTAKKVPVAIGRVERNRVIIVAGLESFSTLIISGSAYLKDGSLIAVQP
ncbi:MAG: efflux RND transporter periplasmic adaptor subunit [Cyclobacteriaceae bacterium]|jgi:RND family efflux transporter MFP subunit